MEYDETIQATIKEDGEKTRVKPDKQNQLKTFSF